MEVFHHVTKIVSVHLGTCHQSANDVSTLFLEFLVLTDDWLPCFWNPSYLESPHQILVIGALMSAQNTQVILAYVLRFLNYFTFKYVFL